MNPGGAVASWLVRSTPDRVFTVLLFPMWQYVAAGGNPAMD